jgi:hypothetical protein
VRKDRSIFFEDSWNEDDRYVPIRKEKRIKNEFKRNKIKNNRGRTKGSGAAD